VFQSDLLAGRAVFITGGGSGLGRAMAFRLAELGAKVFLAGRREGPLQQTSEAIRSSGGTCAYATCDVRDSAAVEAAVDRAEQALGPVDTLINNAAGNFLARTETLSPNGFAAVVGIVLHGTFHCSSALGRRWIASKRSGSILNIVATYAAAGCGAAFIVPSACAKAGVLAMTRSLAVEWGRYGIRVNAIAPGPFPTEGAWSRLVTSKDFEENLKRSNPMQRFGRSDELANLAVYLLSPLAEYINGECIVIDGGQWLRHASTFNNLLDLPESAWDEMARTRASQLPR
jgi:NAD(P)-dependent dehydrogenase (short-subunit alcohol dehydrogenase family)